MILIEIDCHNYQVQGHLGITNKQKIRTTMDIMEKIFLAIIVICEAYRWKVN